MKLADKVYFALKQNGGATISLRGDEPSEGFAVGGATYTQTFDAKAIRPRDVERYLNRNANALARTNRYLGAWESNGIAYLDVAEVLPTETEALNLGRKRAEFAVWDLAGMRELTC